MFTAEASGLRSNGRSLVGWCWGRVRGFRAVAVLQGPARFSDLWLGNRAGLGERSH